jgi:formyl-CoA transferase
VNGTEPKRWGNAHPNLVPYEMFEARDRGIVVAVGSDAQWIACTNALGLDALAADPSLATNAGRLAQRERIAAAMRERLCERDARHWCDALDAAGVPNGVVKGVLESLRDIDASALTGVAPLEPHLGTVRRPPPMLNEHGALVRARGWDAFA